MIESTFLQVAQALLWPVLALVAIAFGYALWVAGATLMEAWQRWRQPGFSCLPGSMDIDMDELEMCALRQIEPLRLLSRVTPMLGLIATMIPLGPALQSVANGQGHEALAVFSGAFAGVVLALAAASVGLVVYSVRRRWLIAELMRIRKTRGMQA